MNVFDNSPGRNQQKTNNAVFIFPNFILVPILHTMTTPTSFESRSSWYQRPCLIIALQWRHNERDDVSNHQPHDGVLNRLFRRRSKKTSQLRVTGLYAGNHRWPVNSPYKRPVTWKMFLFDDVIMWYNVSHMLSPVCLCNGLYKIDDDDDAAKRFIYIYPKTVFRFCIMHGNGKIFQKFS